MNNLFLATLTIILLLANANVAHTQNWNSADYQAAFKFIDKHNVYTDCNRKELDGDEKRVVLPGYRALTSIGDNMLVLEWDADKTFTFFVDEDVKFKENMLNGQYISRSIVNDYRVDEAIKEAQTLLQEIADGKLTPLKPLFESSDRSAPIIERIFNFTSKEGYEYTEEGWIYSKPEGRALGDNDEPLPRNDLVVNAWDGRLEIKAIINGKEEKIDFVRERGPEYNVFNGDSTLPTDSVARKLKYWANYFGIELPTTIISAE